VPLQRLAAGAVPGVHEALMPHFRDAHDHGLGAAHGVEAADRLLSDVLQADMSRVSVRQNEIALRQNDMPGLHRQYGYFAVVVCACLPRHLLFRRNGWL
jgi:magnesium transporter